MNKRIVASSGWTSAVVLAVALAVGAQPTVAQGTALRDARAAALEAAGGKRLGGSVAMLGVLGGAEQDAYLAMMKPFEEATGTRVEYESTRDLQAVLQTRVDGGNPPEVVSTSGIGQVTAFAREGKVVALNGVLEAGATGRDFDANLLRSVTVNGKLYGFFIAVNMEGLIYYNPKSYSGPRAPKTWAELQAWAARSAAAGRTPWCVALESGPASGWPGVMWLTEVLLRQVGPAEYDRWWRGQVPYTSAALRTAFETFGRVATDPKMVNGGPTAVVTTNFLNGADGLYASPPTCALHHQASFFGGIITASRKTLKPVEDVNFFPFPDLNARYPNLRQISGEVVSMFKDTPQARALVRYLASAEAQAILASKGIWLTTNKRVPASAYPNPLLGRASGLLAAAAAVQYDGSGLMPASMTDALWKATVRYVQKPGELGVVLADLERVRKDAYK